ncbi:MAG TPA: AbrB/MazE/SpoVT family DNA-binding domain-containing protein [Candidatus Lustribacter sp.]|nr:AbrB/MazE/SpoVT family DNA-binding domain-containing protein [Candidatus Lustribacter sp.]
MLISGKGQVTIPKPLRDALGLEPGSEVEVVLAGDALLLRKFRRSDSRGHRVAGRLRGRGGIMMKTDDIMALTRGD